MAVLPEPEWQFRHGMWVKAIWKPGPPVAEQDVLYLKWLWETERIEMARA